MHVTFWEFLDIFRTIYMLLNVVIFSSMFWIDGTYDVLSTLKLCTFVIDTLTTSMWLFGSVQTFVKTLHVIELCVFFRHALNRRYLLSVINSSHAFKLTFFRLCTAVNVMDTLKMCMWFFWKCSDFFRKIYIQLNIVIFSACFQRKQYLIFISNSSHTSRQAFSNLLEYLPSAFLFICIKRRLSPS
jgi:hypothetical protein